MFNQFGGQQPHLLVDLATTGAERLKDAIAAMREAEAKASDFCDALVTAGLSSTSPASIEEAIQVSYKLHNIQDGLIDELNRVQTIRELLARRDELSANGFPEDQIAGMVVTEAEARFGANDPRLAVAYLMIAIFFKEAEWYKLASQWMSRAVETQRGAVRVKVEIKSRQADLEKYLALLAGLFALQHDYQRAADTMEEAIYHQQAVYEPHHSRIEFARWALGRYRQSAAEAQVSEPQQTVLSNTDWSSFASAHFADMTTGADGIADVLQQIYETRD